MKRHADKLGSALLAFTLAWSTGATANDGFYLGAEAGANFVEKQKFDIYGYEGVLLGIDDGSRIGEVEFKPGFLGGLVLGYATSSGLRPELEVSFRSNKFDKGKARQGDLLTPATLQKAEGLKGKEEASAAFANLWFDFMKGGSVHPYLGGGAGYAKVELKNPSYDTAQDGYQGDDDKVFVWQAGGGVGFDLSPNLMASVDARYMKSDTVKLDLLENSPNSHTESKYATISVVAGLRYFFGAEPPPPPPAEPVAVVPPAAICSDTLDNDGDGLTDFPADKGCSSADDSDETDPPQCSDGVDNDGDGVVDFPADKGCTAADDNDETDPCKAPAAGERVSLKGCGTGDVIVLRGVNFEFDKSTLTVNAKTILDNVAEELTAYPDITVEVGGHTDAKGSDEYNQSLSERRAKSVVRYLKSKGVAEARMTSAGYGESKPVADNETDEGRELNRRVELKITGGVAGASAAAPLAADTAATPAPAEAAPAADAAPPADAAPAEAAPTP